MAQRSSQRQKHIFCIEGDWVSDLRKDISIVSGLQLLQDINGIKYTHRDAVTKDSLECLLKSYRQKIYSKYSICYLAFHGNPGEIYISKKATVTLEELAAFFGDNCKNKIIHFGSCLILDIHKKKIKTFLRKTNALCVCGFTKKVNFLPSSVFDLLLFEMFQENYDITTVYKKMKKYYGKVMKELGFQMVYL